MINLCGRLVLRLGLIAASTISAAGAEQTLWHLDSLEQIGGLEAEITGEPQLIETGNGKAIEFDGVDDGIFLNQHPLAGFTSFTVEVIFKPYRGGAAEQRFFHMQEGTSDSRVMFETRLPAEGDWFLDTFINTGEQKIPLFADQDLHELEHWYHAAIVVSNGTFSHFVDGRLELSESINYLPQQDGKTSLGVRLNKVGWFKGAIRTVRFTAKALTPEDFLTSRD